MIVFFINCQGSLEWQQIDSAAKFQSHSPFANSKVQIQNAFINTDGSQQKVSDNGSIPAGTRLITIASNECMMEQPKRLSQHIYNLKQELKNIDQQSYTWITQQNLTVDELETLADEDPCIIGVANDAVAVAANIPNDPLLGSAAQFQSIGGFDSYNFFADTDHGSTSDVIVAVIDSGISSIHPDLKNQLWRGSAGEVGYNYISSNNNPSDDFGHGTNVAGIIAAQSNNSTGVAGVMGHNIKIMTLKTQNSAGSAYISDIVSAIYYAQSNGAHVINISMVGYGNNAALLTALQTVTSANIFVAVAAGNDALTISTGSTATYAVPAIYSASINGMMTVGSIVANSTTKSSFSNTGPSYVEIAAPGSGGLYFPNMTGTYSSGTGTSYSAPQVAGAAALVISFLRKNNITYTAADIENIIAQSATENSNLSSYFLNGRTLDLQNLKNYLRSQYLGTMDGGFDGY